MAMIIRTHPSMTVLYSTRQATFKDLPAFSGTVIRELYRYVADLDLLVCGPQYWFYHGVDGKPTTAGGGSPIMSGSRFTLEIALPVQGKIPTALLPYFKQIPAFRCLAYRYEGPWEGLAGAYREMMQYIEDNQLKMNGVYAESFLHIDLDHPASQITEIQIGLI
jgi:effector-binding domain-containing protein